MPTYDYRCPKCDKVEEKYHSMTLEPRIVCKCGGIMEKQMGSPIVKWGKPPDTASRGRECKK